MARTFTPGRPRRARPSPVACGAGRSVCGVGMVAGGHELAMFGGRGARAVALYRSRGAGLREFDLALLRRHVRRQERALRACLGADWRRTDLGLRHLERRVVSEHCLGEGADPDACTCPACTVRRAGPAPGLSCHRGLFHPAPTAAWVAGVAYRDRAHMAHRRVLAASLRHRHILQQL